MSKNKTDDIIVGLFWLVVIVAFGAWLLIDRANNKREERLNEGTSCIDVTSYDYNWSNDMKCTRRDGSVFYTNYEGARKFN